MASIIDDLKQPEALPDPTQNVSVVQTHISIVFVADNFVYKVKKPVDFGFLDFSTLEKRRYYCGQEVELNNRLAKGIYLGVLPISVSNEKYTMAAKDGAPVEFAVKMKRIPDEALMSSMFAKGKLNENNMKRVAQVLADFHKTADRTPKIDTYGELEAFKVNTDENFDQVEKYMGVTISPEIFHSIKRWTNGFYQKNRSLFLDRVKTGKIRDCHGDLHMQHVCITDKINIIDCIEFSDRLRYGDVFIDIGFLLMDLEFHGGHQYSGLLWNQYKTLTNDHQADSLLNFYKIYRAFVRGKVNSFQLDDPHIPKEKKDEIAETAKQYFQLAYSYL